MKKVIKTAEDYEAAMSRLHALLDLDPHPGSDVSDEVELLALLIASYEKERFDRLPAPTAIEAIRFRMEQLGLVQKDLLRYVGSAGRVSEILAGKRPLTLPMIRALSEGLHISTGVLINQKPVPEQIDAELRWEHFPVKEMSRRGWIQEGKIGIDAIRQFVKPVLPYAAAFRRTSHFRGTRNIDKLALLAWLAQVWRRASALKKQAPSFEGNLSDETLREVTRLSWSSHGPLLACEFLERRGILVVIEPALPRTFLDGATIFAPEHPIIGLTLRFDRLDNFWYTLTHELAHVARHAEVATVFLDDMEAGVADEIEVEADKLASETLIPGSVWKSSPASRLRSRQAAEHLARQLQISPAIVAGKIRRESNDFRILGELVGQNSVRRLFTNVDWQEK
jgi:HTH-type transcriptional regulator/antitoxin HigA